MKINLRNYKLGTVVEFKRVDNDKLVYGHIVGFAENCNNEVLIQVQMQTPYNFYSQGQSGPIVTLHPSNIKLL